jgi:uncharacterized protein
MSDSKKRAAFLVLGAILAVLLLAGCGTTIVSAPNNPSANTVTASGSGKISAVPDQAVMTFGVQAQAKDAKRALDGVSAKATKVSSAIKSAGVNDKDIQTANVSIDPQYANSTSPNPPIVGYTASLSVTAKVRELAALSNIISVATKAGATNVNGPTFSIADDSPVHAQAVQKAVDDARRMAQAMAQAAGKSVGDVVSVTSNSGANVSPFPTAFADGAAKDAAVPIQPGQLDVTTNVTVVFQLK